VLYKDAKMNIEFEITHSHISVTKVTVKITGNSDITLWIKISHIEDFFYIYIYKVKINDCG